MTGQIISLIALLVFSAFCSAAETAFTSLSVLQIHDLAKNKGRRGALVEKLTKKSDNLITGILIGNNIANIGASSLATMVTIDLFGSQAVGITTGILTLVILIFAEVTPKRLAISWNKEITLLFVYPVWFLVTILKPFIFLVVLISSGITRFFAKKKNDEVSLDSLLHLVKIANDQGVVKDSEERLVRGVFRFKTVTAGAIMTHRTEVFSLDEDMPVKDAMPLIHSQGVTRVPVYRKNPEEITGIVLADDVVLKFMENGGGARLKDLAREPIFVPETKKISALFYQFQQERLNLAVVLDEYGGLAGIVTREDVIEELLGELYDENEMVEGEKIVKIGEAAYRIQGDTSLYHIHEILGLSFEHDKNIQTIGGYISEVLGQLPQGGEEVTVPGARFRIEGMEKRRIKSLVCFLEPPEKTE